MATDKEQETLKLWLTRFKRSEDYMAPYRQRGRENYKMYKGWKDGSEKLYKHDIFVPYTFAFLEDLTAYFMLSIMASPTLFSLDPRWNSVSVDMCKALEAIVNWVVLEERTEFALEIEELLKNLNIYNSAYLVNYPSLMEVETGAKDGAGEAVKSDAFDFLYLDAPHPFLMFPEPGPKRLSRANWQIKRAFETYETLQAWQDKGIYKNPGDIKKGDRTSEQDPVDELLKSVGISGVEYNENKIELLDCFSDGDVLTIANRRAIIRDTSEDLIRPFSEKLPILDCRFAGAPGEADGIGAAEAIKPLNKELNLLRSQRRDNVAIQTNKVFTYDMLAGEVDLSTLFSAPGNVIIQQGACIDTLDIPDISASSYKEEEALTYDIQNILSFWNMSRGATPKRRETATGIIRLQQAAQARNEWHLRKLDAYILQPLCKRIITYIRNYLPEADAVAIAGNEYAEPISEFYQLDPGDIKRLIHVRPMTDSISSVKEIDTNQFIQAFDRLIQIPGVNQIALIKVLLQKLGQRNIKEIIAAMPSGGGQDATNAAIQAAMASKGKGAMGAGVGAGGQ
jgi:hypothetical protein